MLGSPVIGESAGDSLSPSSSAPPPVHALSFSQINKIFKKINKKDIKIVFQLNYSPLNAYSNTQQLTGKVKRKQKDGVTLATRKNKEETSERSNNKAYFHI